jgi:hypothetical protein
MRCIPEGCNVAEHHSTCEYSTATEHENVASTSMHADPPKQGHIFKKSAKPSLIEHKITHKSTATRDEGLLHVDLLQHPDKHEAKSPPPEPIPRLC